MVKIALQIRVTFDINVRLSPKQSGFNYLLKIKCLNCGEESDKWHDVNDELTVSTARSQTNFHMKCKFCSRENSMDIIQGSNGEYTSDDLGKWKTIIIFDCRGMEPTDFNPGDGWIVKVEESNTVFEDVDLSVNEWVEYDEKIKQPVGVFDFESQFIKVK